MASVLSISPFEQDSLAQQLGLSRAMAQNRALAMQNQYTPQMNQAKIGLMNAQTQNALAPAKTPLSNFQSTYNAWAQAPAGSQLKAGLGQMLNAMTTPKGGLSISQTPGGGFTFNQGVPMYQNGQQGIFSEPLANNGRQIPQKQTNINPMTVSPRSRRGGQVSQVNPNNPNNAVIYTSPTTANTTQTQGRLAADAEIKNLGPQVAQGLAPYNSALGFLPEGRDILLNLFGDDAAKNRLTNYKVAQNLVPDMTAMQGRLAGFNHIGTELLNNIASRQYPNSTHFMDKFLPSSINTSSITGQNNAMENAANTANQQGAINYPVNVPTNKLFYLPQNQGAEASQQLSKNQNSNESQKPGWQNDGTYLASDGKYYTRAQLKKLSGTK